MPPAHQFMSNSQTQSCRGALIAAPGSGQGKTVFTAALARHLVNQGQRVQVLKIGPDYLDRMILECASGRTVFNLDWWMMGERACRQQLFDAVASSDAVLIESLMGLHDNQPTSAWLARRLRLPIILVMNMAKYAQTAAAIVHGMRCYADGAEIAAVVGNRLGSRHHHNLVKAAMPDGVDYLGSLLRDDRMALPQRHLGLVQATEVADLSTRLDAAADYLAAGCLADRPPERALPLLTAQQPAPPPPPSPQLAGRRIAIARDAAFGFIYPANLTTLAQLGADCRFFSPLANQPVPDCDALWLPGGYPECHLAALEKNSVARDSIRAHCAAGKAVLAECGGMMYLGNRIVDKAGQSARMCAVFDADFTMQPTFQSVGYQQLTLRQQSIRGHSFHHSTLQTTLPPRARCQRQDGSGGEWFYAIGNTRLTYMHLYFPSNPALAAHLLS